MRKMSFTRNIRTYSYIKKIQALIFVGRHQKKGDKMNISNRIKILSLCLLASAASLGNPATAQIDPNKIWYTIFYDITQGKKKPVTTYGDQSYSCRKANYAFVTTPNMRANYAVSAPYGYTKQKSTRGKKSVGSYGGWCPKSMGYAACEKRERDRVKYVEHGNAWSNTCISVYWNRSLIFKQ